MDVGMRFGNIAAQHHDPVSSPLNGAATARTFRAFEDITMKRRRVIYEGKAKILYEGTEPGTVIQYFKDDTTAFDAQKKAVIEGKGVLNNRISEYLMTQLAGIGVPTHFVRRLNMREQLIKEVEIIPLEVVVRNVAAGSMSKRLGIEEGTALPRSIIEYYYKNDGLNDPWVSEEHITAFGWASPQDLDDMVNLTIRINDFLSGLFLGAGIKLVDFKLEFGRLWENDYMRIVLADEISPDNCRADLVRQDDAHIVVFPQPPEFQLEIHQLDTGAQKQARQEIIDPDGQVDDVVQVLRAGPAERGDVFFADPGILQSVILVVNF